MPPLTVTVTVTVMATVIPLSVVSLWISPWVILFVWRRRGAARSTSKSHYNIQCSEIFTLRNENLHTETGNLHTELQFNSFRYREETMRLHDRAASLRARLIECIDQVLEDAREGECGVASQDVTRE